MAPRRYIIDSDSDSDSDSDDSSAEFSSSDSKISQHGLTSSREEGDDTISNPSQPKSTRAVAIPAAIPPDDRITGLPDEIRVHILSFLDTDEAVAASFLSKKWNDLWKSTRNLAFRYRRERYGRRSEKFANFVERTLLFHNCNRIKSFSVDSGPFDESGHYPLWVRYAVENNAEEIRVASAVIDVNLYTLSSKLCSNSGLKKLELSCCEFAPNCSISWGSLKRLSLEKVKMGDDIMPKILSSAPLLEELELEVFSGFRKLNISSAYLKKVALKNYNDEREFLLSVSCPNLVCVEISGMFAGLSCQLKDTDSLIQANLNFSVVNAKNEGDYKKYQNMVQSLLEAVSHVAKLALGPLFLLVIALTQKYGLLCPASTCKSLTLDIDKYINKEDLVGIVTFLGSSPNLNDLTIRMSFATRSKVPDPYPRMKGSLSNLVQNLKTVKVIDLSPSQYGTKLLLHLIKDGEKLEEMKIVASERTKPEATLELLKRLLDCPKASSSARITFSKAV